MKHNNLNFRRSTSDRKAESVYKSNIAARFQPFLHFKNRINYHFRSKFPGVHAKMTDYLGKFKQKA